jgi:adenylate cyclase
MRGGYDEPEKIAALRHARTAIASGTDDATALAIAAFVVAWLNREHKAALSAIARALSFNPSSATVLHKGAEIAGASGDLAVATAYAKRAFCLSPFDPF